MTRAGSWIESDFGQGKIWYITTGPKYFWRFLSNLWPLTYFTNFPLSRERNLVKLQSYYNSFKDWPHCAIRYARLNKQLFIDLNFHDKMKYITTPNVKQASVIQYVCGRVFTWSSCMWLKVQHRKKKKPFGKWQMGGLIFAKWHVQGQEN